MAHLVCVVKHAPVPDQQAVPDKPDALIPCPSIFHRS